MDNGGISITLTIYHRLHVRLSDGNTNVPIVSELRLEKTSCFPFEFAADESL